MESFLYEFFIVDSKKNYFKLWKTVKNPKKTHLKRVKISIFF